MARILKYAVTEHGGSESNDDDSISEKHVVITDEPVSIEWIARHPDTPKLNTEYRRHPGFWFDRVNPNRRGKLHWEIDVHASTFQWPAIPSSPLAEAAEISVDSELLTEPTLFDDDGRPIVTRAGEFIAGVTRDRLVWVYKVSKKIAADPIWLESYGCAMNSDAIRIRGRMRPPFTLMLRRGSLSPYVTQNKVTYCTLNFELHYRPETWIQERWNSGTLELFQSEVAGKKVWKQRPILVGTPPQRVDSPVLLDNAGKVIPGVLDPSGEVPLDVSKLTILKFKTQSARPFAVLPLN